MSRARAEGDSLFFEDPVRPGGEVCVYDDGEDVIISPPVSSGAGVWIRRSDVASIADWLRRRYAAHDWRIGVDPTHTSIPIAEPEDKK